MLDAYKYLGYEEDSFEIAEKVSKEILSLPLWPEIKEEDIKKVCEVM
jgi:dTDP-4-amino-4,6-dideoxygalactose transaminase